MNPNVFMKFDYTGSRVLDLWGLTLERLTP